CLFAAVVFDLQQVALQTLLHLTRLLLGRHLLSTEPGDLTDTHTHTHTHTHSWWSCDSEFSFSSRCFCSSSFFSFSCRFDSACSVRLRPVSTSLSSRRRINTQSSWFLPTSC